MKSFCFPQKTAFITLIVVTEQLKQLKAHKWCTWPIFLPYKELIKLFWIHCVEKRIYQSIFITISFLYKALNDFIIYYWHSQHKRNDNFFIVNGTKLITVVFLLCSVESIKGNQKELLNHMWVILNTIVFFLFPFFFLFVFIQQSSTAIHKFVFFIWKIFLWGFGKLCAEYCSVL